VVDESGLETGGLGCLALGLEIGIDVPRIEWLTRQQN